MNSRTFAIQVVKQLQQAGYQALWAGGCVRDQLLGLQPKDYDVATDATPDQVREVFGTRRTLAIGAAFGVITVRGPRTAHPIEVATFRRDVGYSDGRRPDAVQYTDAREDALRRDFTINGMFFDPINEQVIDYVGGQEDLQERQIRAIGVPQQRIEEDKLRMLRGVRFAATYDFVIEAETYRAIHDCAPEIAVVSGERIGAEMRRMLQHSNRAVAAEMMQHSGLLQEILDDGDQLIEDGQRWDQILETLERLTLKEFAAAAAILLEPLVERQGISPTSRRWKLSNQESRAIRWIDQHWQQFSRADELPWSEIQPLLIDDDAPLALAVAHAKQPQSSGVPFCRQRLQWPTEELDPEPLLGGHDLIELGVRPGPAFKRILDEVRRQQLDGELATFEQAREYCRNQDWLGPSQTGDPDDR